MDFNHIITNISQWYEITRAIIPPIDTARLAAFAVMTPEFSAEICEDAAKYHHIMDQKAETAYMIFESKRIATPALATTSAFYRQVLNINEETVSYNRLKYLAVAWLLGAQVHEVYHVKETPSTLMSNLRQLYKKKKLHTYSQSVFASLQNIMEDMRINADCLSYTGHESELLSNLLEMTFNENRIRDLLSKASGAELSAELQIQAFVNTQGLRFLDEETQVKFYEAYPRVKRAVEVATKKWEPFVSVADVLNEVAEILFEGIPAEEVNREGDVGGEGGEVQSPVFSSEEMEQIERIIDDLEKELGEASDEFNEASKDQRKTIDDIGESSFHGRDVAYDNEPKPTEEEYLIEAAAIDAQVFTKLKETRIINVAPGEIRTSGPKMMKHRLHRIVVDDKMFARHIKQATMLKTIDLRFLVDFSGSMKGELLDNSIAFMKTVTKTLQKVGIPNVSYGHTGYRNFDPLREPGLYDIPVGEPYVFKIWENGRNIDRVFNKCTGIHPNHNYDGIAIERVAKDINHYADVKILFVLSDGVPAGHDYHGTEHTMNVIKKVRESGVLVYALSLTEEVIEQNNEIYGTQFNLDASSTAALKASFTKKLINSLEGGA